MSNEQKKLMPLFLIGVVLWYAGICMLTCHWEKVGREPYSSSYKNEKDRSWEIVPAREARAEPRYKIAVIDTGYDPSRATTKAKLCKEGHYDFLTGTPNVNFYQVHGTHVASIIAERLKDVDYCLVILQVFTMEGPDAKADDLKQASLKAAALGVVAVNMSFGGTSLLKEEYEGVQALERAHIPIFAAAGNDHMNLDKNCVYFPACYGLKNILIIGTQDVTDPKKPAPNSNYGKRVTIWAPGTYEDEDHLQAIPATSYATPRALSEYVLFLENKRLADAHRKK